MSGFIGILNGGGRPVDAGLLRAMTASMASRAPDAQEVWCDAHVGFGHALLRTTREAETERQPQCLDGAVWITGDIRLDRRRELADRLRAAGRRFDKEASDADLVLHAYLVWDQACVEQLSGDFAFAIWDGRSRRLFCARDQFGVVPFYYAETKDALVFGNHLDCLRLHPQVSDRFNEQAIGDFLLVSINYDFATTTFAAIRRLLPAHVLTWSDGNPPNIRRYWRLPEVETYLHYRDRREYVEQFRELFERAVADRLRTGCAGTYLSGGMDSTSIAATAYRLMAATGSAVDLQAYTIAAKTISDHHEGEYAAKVAAQTGFPIEYVAAEDYMEAVPEEHPRHNYPEPLVIPERSAMVDITHRAAKRSRVLLAGFGGDPALSIPWCYWIDLAKRYRFLRLARDTWEYVRAFHSVPGFGLRTQVRAWQAEKSHQVGFPDWFDPDFVARIDLKTRQKVIDASASPLITMRSHEGMLSSPLWCHIFTASDPGVTGLPIKVRFPFFDVRLLLFLHAIPPIPWLMRKFLIREAMKGRLPEAVRMRPKATVASAPSLQWTQRRGVQPWMERLAETPALAPYVDRKRLLQRLRNVGELNQITHAQTQTTLVLAYWLDQWERSRSVPQ